MFSRNGLVFKCAIHRPHVRPPGPAFPFFLSEVIDLGRAGEGCKVKAFSSLVLAACWERVAWKIDALEKRLGSGF